MSALATHLPLHARLSDDRKVAVLSNSRSEAVARLLAFDLDMADEIARRVNSHDDLLAALEEACAQVRSEFGLAAVEANFPKMLPAIAKARGES